MVAKHLHTSVCYSTCGAIVWFPWAFFLQFGLWLIIWQAGSSVKTKATGILAAKWLLQHSAQCSHNETARSELAKCSISLSSYRPYTEHQPDPHNVTEADSMCRFIYGNGFSFQPQIWVCWSRISRLFRLCQTKLLFMYVCSMYAVCKNKVWQWLLTFLKQTERENSICSMTNLMLLK